MLMLSCCPEDRRVHAQRELRPINTNLRHAAGALNDWAAQFAPVAVLSTLVPPAILFSRLAPAARRFLAPDQLI